jgi:uncharacterized Zn-finger protein
MFERFTERARQVIVLAQDEARTLKHNYIGTEHILLGLLREEEGLAARVLDTLDITVEEVRAQVTRIVGQGDQVATGQIPFTPRTKKVFELAFREALSLDQKNIDTEHILLGLAREGQGIAARILRDFDADISAITDETLRMLSGPGRQEHAPRGSAGFYIPAEGETTSVARQRYDEPLQSPRLLVACPTCATPIETVSTDHPAAHLQVSMQGNHTCPGCGRRWAITLTAAWTDPSPPTNPEDDVLSRMAFWHHSEPSHFMMTCFRCQMALERITLDRAATSLAHIQDEGDHTCPSCRKPWRISYTVSWEERPSGSCADD